MCVVHSKEAQALACKPNRFRVQVPRNATKHTASSQSPDVSATKSTPTLNARVVIVGQMRTPIARATFRRGGMRGASYNRADFYPVHLKNALVLCFFFALCTHTGMTRRTEPVLL